ncbi:MAG: hypothetical protein M3450_12895, partial [Actinomycetota bacterium]|nr:hypothetical protein [Actinomycetota bacterium]
QLPYVIDLNYLYDLRTIGEKSLHDVAESLNKLNQEIASWRSPQGPGITVWTRDRDRYVAEDRWQYGLTGKRRSLAFPELHEWAKWPGRFSLVRAAAMGYREWQQKRRRQD